MEIFKNLNNPWAWRRSRFGTPIFQGCDGDILNLPRFDFEKLLDHCTVNPQKKSPAIGVFTLPCKSGGAKIKLTCVIYWLCSSLPSLWNLCLWNARRILTWEKKTHKWQCKKIEKDEKNHELKEKNKPESVTGAGFVEMTTDHKM